MILLQVKQSIPDYRAIVQWGYIAHFTGELRFCTENGRYRTRYVL